MSRKDWDLKNDFDLLKAFSDIEKAYVEKNAQTKGQPPAPPPPPPGTTLGPATTTPVVVDSPIAPLEEHSSQAAISAALKMAKNLAKSYTTPTAPGQAPAAGQAGQAGQASATSPGAKQDAAQPTMADLLAPAHMTPFSPDSIDFNQIRDFLEKYKPTVKRPNIIALIGQAEDAMNLATKFSAGSSTQSFPVATFHNASDIEASAGNAPGAMSGLIDALIRTMSLCWQIYNDFVNTLGRQIQGTPGTGEDDYSNMQYQLAYCKSNLTTLQYVKPRVAGK